MANLLVCKEEWVEIMEENDFVDNVYTDFSRAFDNVPQKFRYGWKNNWLDFLSNRQQQVRVDSKFSFWKLMLNSIPQGSVLLPILFVFFINDMTEFVQSIC